jgi:hypothetical protein
MSFDLMVFRAEAAPREIKQFEKWYFMQTEWTEDVDYDDYSHASINLREWFLEMQQSFPALNGPLANDDLDDSKVADYGIGTDSIYVGFSWEEAEAAYNKAFELAGRYGVGFYDPQSEAVFYPGNNGALERLMDDKRPWWKIW